MERIQRKRTKGWRMPKNTLYVGRPTKWGNKFTSLTDYEYWVKWECKMGRLDLEELRGKNLCCWCKPQDPCHCDVLLRLLKVI
jgi:hypothetical protein